MTRESHRIGGYVPKRPPVLYWYNLFSLICPDLSQYLRQPLCEHLLRTRSYFSRLLQTRCCTATLVIKWKRPTIILGDHFTFCMQSPAPWPICEASSTCATSAISEADVDCIIMSCDTIIYWACYTTLHTITWRLCQINILALCVQPRRMNKRATCQVSVPISHDITNHKDAGMRIFEPCKFCRHVARGRTLIFYWTWGSIQ